jgi:protocatechuate 3,4-dioxygenase, beta subunit
MTVIRAITRRALLYAGLALSLAAQAVPVGAAALVATPSDGPGRLFPDPATWSGETDTDLVRIAGQPRQAYGQVLYLRGRILDLAGRPLAGTTIEIWQTDALGHYHRPGHPRANQDPNFQGYGRMTVGEDGAYRFRTVKPVPYLRQAPHIHFRLTRPGMPPFGTRLYLAGQDRNARDPVLSRIEDPAARASLIVQLREAPELERDALLGHFDILLKSP